MLTDANSQTVDAGLNLAHFGWESNHITFYFFTHYIIIFTALCCVTLGSIWLHVDHLHLIRYLWLQSVRCIWKCVLDMIQPVLNSLGPQNNLR